MQLSHLVVHLDDVIHQGRAGCKEENSFIPSHARYCMTLKADPFYWACHASVLPFLHLQERTICKSSPRPS
ncbi:Transcription factor atf21 [Fusarium oxysporum f. sp. albedinis]|nr:Transcription factor atf21 [Fusarium oxysporum f. sp. albedinis]